jgi:hypothetical protein
MPGAYIDDSDDPYQESPGEYTFPQATLRLKHDFVWYPGVGHQPDHLSANYKREATQSER